MTPDNKGAPRPAMHDAPDSVTPMTTPSSAPDSTMQEANGLLRRLEHQYAGDEDYDDTRYLGPDRASAIGDVRLCISMIRALMDQTAEERMKFLDQMRHAEAHIESLEPEAKAFRSSQSILANIESLEAERDIMAKRLGPVGVPTPSEIAARVADRRKEQER